MHPLLKMETFGRANTPAMKKQKAGTPPRVVAAWSRAILATALALATVVVSVAADGAAAASGGSNAAVVEVSSMGLNVNGICLSTPYPSACRTALSAPAAGAGPWLASVDPFAASVRFAMARAASARALARNLSAAASSARLRGGAPSGMDDCAELLDITSDQLAGALAARTDDAEAVTTWLSAAMTNQATCEESLVVGGAVAAREAVRARVSALAQFIGTALALHVNKVRAAAGTAPTTPPTPEDEALPSWVSEHDRKLILTQQTSSSSAIATSAVVAQDGSGTHRSIGEAIAAVTAAAAEESSGRKVIYVKAGRYEETLSISSKQRNVMLMGDGKGKTVIVGHKSVGDGSTTYNSATVAAMGSGFIAKGLTIVNSAGPGKGQAVALRVGGDLSVIYDCAIEAYQDTLYAHSNRQFYANSDISGTVDFIFGNAAVVLQSCDIQARRPRPGQKDTVTAQGRTDPNQNTGTSIHRCRVTGAPDLGGTQVFLGRPWQRYSRTVVMRSFLDAAVAPAGWLEWSGQFALDTLYYGEYGNTGPGAGTGKRVTWSGVHPAMATSDAAKFTVARFIGGDSWLGGTGVSYVAGL